MTQSAAPMQPASQAPRYYRPVYHTPWAKGLPAYGLAAALAVPAAVVYVFLTVVSPIPWINLGLVLGFGGALAFIARWTARRMGIRHRPGILGLAIGTTLAGFLAAWWVWPFLMLWWTDAGVPFGEYLLHPSLILDVMDYAVRHGFWELGRSGFDQRAALTLNGIYIIVIWIGEAAGIFGIGVWLSYGTADAPRPPCEACGADLPFSRTLHSFSNDALGRGLLEQVERKNWRFLSQLSEPGAVDRVRVRLECECCDKCGKACLVSLVQLTKNVGTKSRKPTAKTLLDRLVVTPRDIQAIEASPPRAVAEAY